MGALDVALKSPFAALRDNRIDQLTIDTAMLSLRALMFRLRLAAS